MEINEDDHIKKINLGFLGSGTVNTSFDSIGNFPS
jgi:hypothetical protein